MSLTNLIVSISHKDFFYSYNRKLLNFLCKFIKIYHQSNDIGNDDNANCVPI